MRPNGSAVLVAVAVVVGLVCGLPHGLIPLQLSDPAAYTPLVISDVSFVTFDETFNYAARAREVMDGRWRVTDPLAWEYKTVPAFYAPPEQVALGVLARALGSVDRVFVLADVVFPAIDFLLIVLFLRALGAAMPLACLGALAILSGGVQNSVRLLVDVARVAAGGDPATLARIVRPLEFTRTWTPELTFVLLIGGFIALWHALERRSWAWAALCGVCVAMLIPSYYFYWMFLAASVAVLGARALLTGPRDRAPLLGFALVLGAALATPYWLSYRAFQQLPEAVEITTRFGLEPGRHLVVPSLKDVALLAALAAAARVLGGTRFVFMLALGLALVLCRNVQLVTGFTVQSGHWGYRTVVIWQTLSLATLLTALPGLGPAQTPTRLARALRAGAGAGAVVLVVAMIGHQVVLSRNTAPAFTLPPGFAEAFAWINRSTPRDSVIVSPSFETSLLIPAHTHANVFMPTGLQALAPNRELVERLLLTYKAYGVPTSYLAASLRDVPDRLRATNGRFSRRQPELLEQWTAWYLFQWQPILPADRAALVERYERLALDPARPFGPYRADYVWMSSLEATKGPGVLSHSWLERVYENGGVTIARVRR